MKFTIAVFFGLAMAVSAQWRRGSVGHSSVGHQGTIGHNAGHSLGHSGAVWAGRYRGGRSLWAPAVVGHHGTGHLGAGHATAIAHHGSGLDHHRWARSVVFTRPVVWGTGLHGLGLSHAAVVPVHHGLVATHHGLIF